MIFVGVALLISAALALLVSADAGTMIGLGQDQTAQLVALIMVLVLVAGGAFGRRYPLSQILSNIVMWIGIFAVALVAYTYRDEFSSIASRVMGELAPGEPVLSADSGSVTIRRGISGSFRVNADVNGVSMPMVFDTGASAVVLSYNDAQAAGIDVENLRFAVPVRTANGVGRAAQVRLASVHVGSITRNNISAFVSQQGALETSLLGMSFLETLSSYTVTRETLELVD